MTSTNIGGSEVTPPPQQQQEQRNVTEQTSKPESEKPEKSALDVGFQAEREKVDLDTATDRPTEAIHTGDDYKRSESIEEAFKTTMGSSDADKTEQQMGELDGKEDADGPTDHEEPEDQSGDPGERGEETSGAEGSQDQPTGMVIEAAAESVQTTENTAPKTAESVRAAAGQIDRTDDQPELVMVSADGESGDKVDLGQDTYEQSGDIRQDTSVSDKFAPGGSGTMGEEHGYMGGVSDLEPGAEVTIPDPLSGGPGEMIDAGLPGPDQMGELDVLAAAAAFGIDGRLGFGSELTNAIEEYNHQVNLQYLGVENGTEVMNAYGEVQKAIGKEVGGTRGKLLELAGKLNSGEELTTEEEEWLSQQAEEAAKQKEQEEQEQQEQENQEEGEESEEGEEGEEGEETGGEEGETGPEGDDTSPEEYDPEGTAGSTPTNDDPIEAALRAMGMPTERPTTTTPHESVSQPVGEEESGTYRDPNIVFDRASQIDPYAQYTGEETGGFGVMPTGEGDVDGDLIDPPDLAGGGEGIQGRLQALESRVAVSDSAKNDQAAAVLQEQALAGKGEADLQTLAANVVKAQYGDLSAAENDTLMAVVAEKAAGALDSQIAALQDKLQAIGDDTQLSNLDLQNQLQKQQQTLQTMSNVSSMLHDTAMAIVRNIK